MRVSKAVDACLARIFHEWPTATTKIAFLPGVLGPRTLRRTVGVRVPAVARWHGHLHGLVTTIHEISGLAR